MSTPPRLDALEHRDPDHEIESILWERWSPRAMSGEPVDAEHLRRLFEAARWAPSSFNRQPWHFLYARRDTPHWDTFFDLLTEGNQRWADQAGVLIAILSRRRTQDGKPIRTHSFDTGAAWQNLALQGASMDLVVHGMEGFDYDRARSALAVPDDFEVEAMAAIGMPGSVDDLAEKDRSRETPRDRVPGEELATEGPYRHG